MYSLAREKLCVTSFYSILVLFPWKYPYFYNFRLQENLWSALLHKTHAFLQKTGISSRVIILRPVSYAAGEFPWEFPWSDFCQQMRQMVENSEKPSVFTISKMINITYKYMEEQGHTICWGQVFGHSATNYMNVSALHSAAAAYKVEMKLGLLRRNL